MQLRRACFFAIALTIIGGALWWAFAQPLRPHALLPPTTIWSFDWWSHPIERNAFKRLPIVEGGRFADVDTVPGTSNVWAVDSFRLGLRTTDHGKTWTRLALPRSSPTLFANFFEHRQLDLTSRKYLHFASPMQGWVSSMHELFVTHDGGQTWSTSLEDRGAVDDFMSPYWTSHDGRELRVRQSKGDVFSTDGGASWRPLNTSRSYDRRTFVLFTPDGAYGWHFDRSRILRTGDRGRTWSLANAPVISSVPSVGVAVDRERLWVNGPFSLLRSDDGGESWTPIDLGTQNNLLSIVFSPDGRRGAASSTRGAIHVTDDGSAWRETWPMAAAPVKTLRMSGDGLVVTGVTTAGEVLRATAGDWQWHVVSQGVVDVPTNFVFDVSGRSGWAQLGSRQITTTDGGVTWRPALGRGRVLGGWETGTTTRLVVQKEDPWGIVVVPLQADSSGRASLGPNVGAFSGLGGECSDFGRLADGRGWLSCERGDVTTEVGGLPWRHQPSKNDDPVKLPKELSDVESTRWSRIEGDQRWILVSGRALSVCSTARSCVSHGNLERTQDTRLESFDMAAELRGFVVEDGRLMMFTAGPPMTAASSAQAKMLSANRTLLTRVIPLTLGTETDVHAVRFIGDGRRGWVVGDRGFVALTTDGGVTWQARTTPTTDALSAVWGHEDGQLAFATGPSGVMLRSTNGGVSWHAIQHAWYPAPWLYPVLTFGGLFLYLALRPVQTIVEERTIAQVASSDRAIDTKAADRLNLAPTAEGVARFLANESTEPPLTIAVTGEWGSGKSSLMNLVRADLRERGFRTVWFNAWHHQTDEHLLGSLVAALRKDALLPWWRPDGLGTRTRLLWLRGRAHWGPMCLTIGVFAIALGYLIANPDRLDWLTTLFDLFMKSDPAKAGGEAASATSSATAGASAAPTNVRSNAVGLLAVLGALAPVVTFLRSMQAFGKRPLTLASRASAFRDLKMPTGFRQQFADVFGEVTEALAPRRLVIFIDDLDRCQPERIASVLELVSFLMSSGRCFIVLGMAWDRVERCVGLAFKDVAQELVDGDIPPEGSRKPAGRDRVGDTSNDDEARAARGRAAQCKFARHYLEKLINIEVPVPVATSDRIGRLFEGDAVTVTNSARYLGAVRQLATRWGPAVAIISVAVAGGVFGYGHLAGLVSSPRQTEQSTLPGPATGVTTSGPAPGAGAIANKPDVTTGPPQASSTAANAPAIGVSSGPRYYTPSFVPRSPWALLVTAMTALLGIGIYRLLLPPLRLEKDSPAFKDALAFWHPLVFVATPTPRALKRYLNRVRYLAMQDRGEDASAAGAKAGDAKGKMPEAILVALAAMHHSGFDVSSPFRDFMIGEPGRWLAMPSHLQTYLRLEDNVVPLRRWHRRFTRLARGVHVH